MLKGKAAAVYTVVKIALYAVACLEYLTLAGPAHMAALMPAAAAIVADGFFRQFFLMKRDNLRRYGQASILLDLALGACIVWLQPTITPAVLLLVPAAIDYLSGLELRERESIERSNKELEQAYKQLLDNASKIQELSIEKERNRMAGEIHDILAHTLTAVVVQLEACKKLIDVDAPRAKAEIEKAQELTRAGLGEVRRTVRDLRPQILDYCCLMHALTNLFQDIEESAHVCVALHEDLNQELQLSSTVEVAIYRVLQESLTNAIRHGAAERIDVSLTERENMLDIDIADNGRGCAHIKEGYGMRGIVERIKGLGGTVRFFSSAGKGFRTQIAIPYKGGSVSGN